MAGSRFASASAALGLRDQLRGGVSPIGLPGPQVVPFLQHFHGRRIVALAHEDASQDEVDFGKFRVLSNRLAECSDGLVELALVIVCEAKASVGFGKFGIEPDGCAEFDLRRRIVLHDIAQKCAEAAVGQGVVGLEPDDLSVLGDGLVELALVMQGESEPVAGAGRVGLRPSGCRPGDRAVLCRAGPRPARPGFRCAAPANAARRLRLERLPLA